MPRDGNPVAPPRRRSRTVRAAALVTLGLGATGCDEAPPPDLPGQTEARVDACRAAHRRLGEDPARCDVLEQVIAREHGASRPHFTTVAACETVFGQGSCEGTTIAATGPNWRPALVGWARAPDDQRTLQPVVQDRSANYWALPDPVAQPGQQPATQSAPRNIQANDVTAVASAPPGSAYSYFRLAPIYPDEATCTAEWQGCERFDFPLPNRFATQATCQASWSRCIEVELPESALTMAVNDAQPQDTTATTTTSRYYGGSRPGWWFGYNSGYRQNYVGGIGPRYQGWTWTADRQPTAAYRPARGTGPLQAWDSSSRRLGTANQMGVYRGSAASRVSGSTISRPASTISRAGFGSTGRAYSSGG